MSEQESGVVFIWDSDSAPIDSVGTTILWRRFSGLSALNDVSIPTLIERNAYELRARYLEWIYDLGRKKYRNKRIVDHLQLCSGFSYWWMTLIAEKCNFSKSPKIDDVIRLMAFEDWLLERKIDRLILASANEDLVECMQDWCAKNSVCFEWKDLVPLEKKVSLVRKIYQHLPNVLKGGGWLVRHLAVYWPLRGVGISGWKRSEARISFFSYLFNLDPDAVDAGRYSSRYWGNLPELLVDNGCESNWLHLWIKDSTVSTASKAKNIIKQFNQRAGSGQNHVALDSFIGMGVVVRTLLDWLRMMWVSKSLHRSMMSGNEDSKFNAWPLIRNDWRESIQGQAAVSNILYYNLFKSALSCLASQDKGVYLQENQGWEFGLIRAWREAGHGEIIGAPHATIKFWDLRRFFDPRNYQQKGGNVLPLPDYVALNGEMAKERYLEGGYPAECLVECEALRYLYLESEVRQKREVKKLGMPLKFLVLGDFLSENTVWQLKLLEEFCISSRANIDIFVRPHPACPIEVQDYPGIDMEMTNMALSELLKVCDVAYTSSTTSAAVDAYSAGIDVISVLNPNSLNLSPLRGLNGVSFVSSPEELAEAIKCQSAERVGLNEYSEYFFLDADLTRWISLICDSDYSNRLKLRYINE